MASRKRRPHTAEEVVDKHGDANMLFAEVCRTLLLPTLESRGFAWYGGGSVVKGEYATFRRQNDWVVFYLDEGVALHADAVVCDRAGQSWHVDITRMAEEVGDRQSIPLRRWSGVELARYLAQAGSRLWVRVLETQDSGCAWEHARRLSAEGRKSYLESAALVKRGDLDLRPE